MRRVRGNGAPDALDGSALELFARVVAAGSLSLAAKRLGQTRAAVSRRLAALEARLGQPLLVRTTRSIALTETGRRLLPPAMAVLESGDQARGVLRSIHSSVAGRLRLTTLPSFGNTVVLPLVARFAELHRGVRFDLVFTDRRVDLAKEGVDVAFRITRKPPPHWVARDYCRIRVGAFARPDKFQPLAHPSMLASLPLLLLGSPAPPVPLAWQRLEGGGDAIEVESESAIRGEDLLSLVRLAELGAGIVLAPDYCVREALHRGALIDVLPRWHLPIPQGDRVQILTLPSRQLGPAARAFVRFTLEEAQQSGTVSSPL